MSLNSSISRFRKDRCASTNVLLVKDTDGDDDDDDDDGNDQPWWKKIKQTIKAVAIAAAAVVVPKLFCLNVILKHLKVALCLKNCVTAILE